MTVPIQPHLPAFVLVEPNTITGLTQNRFWFSLLVLLLVFDEAMAIFVVFVVLCKPKIMIDLGKQERDQRYCRFEMHS